MAGRKAIDTATRFWEKVRKTETCWFWTAQINNKGYGCFVYQGRLVYAHRMAWRLTLGDPPIGKNILHRCDVPACVNPSHLFVGGQTENMLDCSAKGRISRGERHPYAKLTTADVLAIRADTRAQRTIAAEFGIKQMTVSDIKRGKTWKHV